MAIPDYRNMNRKTVLTLTLVICGFAVFAQKNEPAKTAVVFVVGKVLSQKDSIQVKDLYFDGLREKIIQNYQLAGDYFNRVLEIDPANDAVMFELASMSFAQNKDAEAERLIRKAVTVKPENEWYWALLADIYKKTNNIVQLVPVLDELTRIAPGNEVYYYDKANALLILKKVTEAATAYDDIEKRFGTSDDLSAARQRMRPSGLRSAP